jgi:hypothetical protein
MVQSSEQGKTSALPSNRECWLDYSDCPRPKALKLQALNKALTKALAIFSRKFRPWPSLRESREYHYVILFSPSFLLRRRTLLFDGAEKPRARKPSAPGMEEEKIVMQELADKEEDARPDGAIEIDSDEEYR